jgi:hypothetical protein
VRIKPLFFLLALGACAHDAPKGFMCAAGEMRALRAEIFLGRSIKTGGEVSERDFADFLAKSVTPLFPDGFSVFDGRGQYLSGGTTKPIREKSKLLLIVAPDNETTAGKIGVIAEAYKRRFAQDSVGIVRVPACSKF